MNRTTGSRLALPALALAGALALSACGGGTDTATTGASAGHGSGQRTDGGNGEAKGNAADVSFLTGMKPHHEQAVEMSEIVLAADPPAEVAAIARRIQGAQAPEIEQMDRMLADLGVDTTGGRGGAHGDAHGDAHGATHGDGHGGMMSDEQMAALRAATGTQAARLYLEAMIEHHQGAIEASAAEIDGGEHQPAVQLAREITTAQAAEITVMQGLLRSL